MARDDGNARGGRDMDGRILAFHGTMHELNGFRALSHFGTIRAAVERLVTRSCAEGFIHPVALDLGPLVRVTDGDAILHHRPETYARRFQRQGILTREQADAVCGRMGTYEASDLLGRTLLALGHGGIVYRNKYEDPGSTSWIVLSPDQVSPLGPPVRVAVRDLEALLERDGPLSMDDIQAPAPDPAP